MGYAPALDEVCVEKNAVVARVSGHDSIEILRITLRFAKCLLSSGGATGEVGMHRRLAVEGSYHCLCIFREHMRAAVGPVANSLRTTCTKAERVSLMTGVRTTDSETTP